MMHILLLGASLDSLLLSSHLRANDHTVTIVEIEAEIGLPLHHPGRVIEISHFSDFFTQEQMEFLALHENDDGWGCRWEWVLKHVAHRVAQQGVSCLLRTRVLDVQQHADLFHVTISSNERNVPTNLTVDTIIDMQPRGQKVPGQRCHAPLPSPLPSYPFPDQEPWMGGMALFSTVQDEDPDADLVLRHADGLVELWWKGPQRWSPANGFIETCQVDLPTDIDEISFDAIVRRVNSFAASIV